MAEQRSIRLHKQLNPDPTKLSKHMHSRHNHYPAIRGVGKLESIINGRSDMLSVRNQSAITRVVNIVSRSYHL